MSSARTTRATRVAEGRCAVCLRRWATVGHSTCRICREAIAEYSAKRYAERRDAGECTRSGCNEPASGYLCETHAEERRQRRRDA